MFFFPFHPLSQGKFSTFSCNHSLIARDCHRRQGLLFTCQLGVHCVRGSWKVWQKLYFLEPFESELCLKDGAHMFHLLFSPFSVFSASFALVNDWSFPKCVFFSIMSSLVLLISRISSTFGQSVEWSLVRFPHFGSVQKYLDGHVCSFLHRDNGFKQKKRWRQCRPTWGGFTVQELQPFRREQPSDPGCKLSLRSQRRLWVADFDSDTPASSTLVLNCPMSCSLFFLDKEKRYRDNKKKNHFFFAVCGFYLIC